MALVETFVTTYRSPLPLSVPIVVISAEQGPFPEDRQNEAFLLAHKLLARSVERGEWVLAERANHTSIADTRSDLVTESVRRLLAFRN